MAFQFGSATVRAVKLGASNVDAIYLGADRVFGGGGGGGNRLVLNGNGVLTLNGKTLTMGS